MAGGRRPFDARMKVAALLVPVSMLVAPAAIAGQAAQPAEGQVRVPTSHANVHMGPTSTQQVLVMVPEGTILSVIERRGEWLAVRLSPELRETGIVLRWYRGEDRGYLHDSTVEPVAAAPR